MQKTLHTDLLYFTFSSQNSSIMKYLFFMAEIRTLLISTAS